tara:strand:+ start:1298 stop:1486 length:189 start_codon:yes stop_codon:yes gene_type:complete
MNGLWVGDGGGGRLAESLKLKVQTRITVAASEWTLSPRRNASARVMGLKLAPSVLALFNFTL